MIFIVIVYKVSHTTRGLVMSNRNILKPEIIQYCWVVPSLESAAQIWFEALGVGPFIVMRNISITEPIYRGKAGQAEFSVALAMNGGVQIELIEQHDDVPSAYRDTVTKGTTAFHHVGILDEDYDKAIEYYTARDYEIAQSGTFGDVRYAYVDTSPMLGHMIELIEDRESIRDLFSYIERAHDSWDKNRGTLIQEMDSK
jgi:hypothetical protein